MSKKSKHKTMKLKRGKIYTFIKKVIGPFAVNKPKIIYREELTEKKYIFICNHGYDGYRGTFVNEGHNPFPHVSIAMSEMFQSFRKRWLYLYMFNFRLRRGSSKLSAFFGATFQGLLSLKLYKASRVIPSYKDGRLVTTFKKTFYALQNDYSVVAYVDNLEQFYNNVFASFRPGFVLLAEKYYKKYNEDVKVVVINYNVQLNRMVFDKPFSIQELLLTGMTRNEIADFFCQRSNQLFADYLEPLAFMQEDYYHWKILPRRKRKLLPKPEKFKR